MCLHLRKIHQKDRHFALLQNFFGRFGIKISTEMHTRLPAPSGVPLSHMHHQNTTVGAASTQSSITLHLCCTESIELAPALADRPRLPLPRTGSCGMLTVVLDLDNTLVFTRVLDADSATVLVTLRPYLCDLLHLALAHCEVFVWTAGRRHYASHAVQRMLDYFKLPRVPYLITRDDEGWYNEYETFKDVQLLGRDMDSVLLVEDSVPYARVSCNNSVIVPSYRGEPTDQVLRNLTELLQQMVCH